MFQIEKTQHGSTKIVKWAIDRKPCSFETAEAAQKLADSMFANWRCDWKSQGRRAPIYKVVEA